MNKKDRLIITGGNGFIGQNLVEGLLKAGYANIVIIDRTEKISRVKTIQTDVSDIGKMKKIIQKGDTVVHLACTTIPAYSEDDIIKDVDENIVGTIKLLNVCSEKKIKKFIFLSSGGTVYGDHGRKSLKEDEETNPICAHGLMKLTIEKYIKHYNLKYCLKYIIIRAGNPFGRTEVAKPQGAIDKYICAVCNNTAIEVWGDGEVTRDFIIIDDLVDLIIKIVKSKIENQIINAGTGRGMSLNQIIAEIKKIIGKNVEVVYKKGRKFDLPYNVLNINKAKRLYCWQPKYSTAQGIKIAYNRTKTPN